MTTPDQDQITVKYEGIDITYDEGDNRWKFVLRNRHRSADSLSKAKEAIDKPVEEKAEKPFARTPIFFSRYGEEFLEGDATSVADNDRYSATKYVWVVSGKERCKVATYSCIPRTEANVAIVNEWKELDKQAEAIREKQGDLESRLTKLEV